MKQQRYSLHVDENDVVSLVDTWIETNQDISVTELVAVVSLVDTWIETSGQFIEDLKKQLSCPSWTRGLKPMDVTSYYDTIRRVPRGHVD